MRLSAVPGYQQRHHLHQLRQAAFHGLKRSPAKYSTETLATNLIDHHWIKTATQEKRLPTHLTAPAGAWPPAPAFLSLLSRDISHSSRQRCCGNQNQPLFFRRYGSWSQARHQEPLQSHIPRMNYIWQAMVISSHAIATAHHVARLANIAAQVARNA